VSESTAPARIVPEVPSPKDRIKLLVDTDAANEIDDLYAVALAIAAQDRFDIKGFVASHFASRAGPESIDQSYDVLVELFAAARVDGQFPLKRGSHPMRYPRVPEPSAGVDLIIDCAKQCTPDDPLWVVCLGAATDLASALLLAPEITDKVRLLYHGRSEGTWPHRTEQFNVYGDIIATQTLLQSRAPLLWFDTGTHLVADMETTAKRLAPLGEIGRYLHEYRYRQNWLQAADKGFFDLGDIAWLIDPRLCRVQEINAPEMTRWMTFRQTDRFGRILHIGSIDVNATWELFYSRMQQHFGTGN
jgi:inosine-uridine nucleoside N-ribohydrolase